MGQIQDIPYEILNVLEFNRCLDFLTMFIICVMVWGLTVILIFLFSTRKRQSVVCRYPDGRLVLYCKVSTYKEGYFTWITCIQYHRTFVWQGADNVIYERLRDGESDLKKRTREHLEHFGAAGLRTLCLAYRDLNPDVYESWNEKFIQAKSSLREREKKLDEVRICSSHCCYIFLILLL